MRPAATSLPWRTAWTIARRDLHRRFRGLRLLLVCLFLGVGALAAIGSLTGAIREVIADAIAAGGSTLRDHIRADGSLGYFQHSFSVYDREKEACRTPGCTGTIGRIVQGGRSTFYCAACQK